MKVKLVKLKELEDARHPNNIQEGFEKIGLRQNGPPRVGNRFWVDNFSTSPVQEIIDDRTFRTLNSIYQYEILEKIVR